MCGHPTWAVGLREPRAFQAANITTRAPCEQKNKAPVVLQVILGVRPALLDRMLPKLLGLPLVEHRVRAAGPILGQTDSHHLSRHISFSLQRLLALPQMQRSNSSLRAACLSAASATAAAATDAATVSELVRSLLKHLEISSSRHAAAAVVRDWAPVTTADFDLHKPILIATLVELFGEPDDDEGTLAVVWAAAKAVLGTIDKQDMPGHVAGLRKALQSAHDVARHNTETGEDIIIPGCVWSLAFC
jgi:hypothetical protein